MNRTSLLLGLVVMASTTVACSGTYRVVKKTGTGGVVALQGPQESAHQAANQYMASQCPSGVDILEEGEAVIGADTAATTRPGFFGSNTSASTTEKREWRITYQCKGTGPAPTAPAAPTAPTATPPTPVGQVRTVIITF